MGAAAPLFSIATPVRNDLARLRRCVGSLRGQQGARLEHLVQDAASADGTAAWLTAQADLRWASEPDAGLYDAIDRAWRRARGDVLAWLNADEQYLPGTLAAVAQAFARDPTIDVLYGDYVVCGPAGEPVALRREIPFRRRYVANGFLYAASCTTFFRRRLFDSGRLHFDTGLRYAADMDLMLRLARDGANIVHLPRYLALFGVDGGNLSHHPGMQAETEQVRRRHGGFASPALRALVLAGRRIERLLRGGYLRRDLTYRYALDEAPRYAERRAQRVGGRYAIADFAAS